MDPAVMITPPLSDGCKRSRCPMCHGTTVVLAPDPRPHGVCPLLCALAAEATGRLAEGSGVTSGATPTTGCHWHTPQPGQGLRHTQPAHPHHRTSPHTPLQPRTTAAQRITCSLSMTTHDTSRLKHNCRRRQHTNGGKGGGGATRKDICADTPAGCSRRKTLLCMCQDTRGRTTATIPRQYPLCHMGFPLRNTLWKSCHQVAAPDFGTRPFIWPHRPII
jgi:hypothetical protein